MATKKTAKSIKAINDQGILLVFPLANRKEPRSVWSELYPRTPMRWEWDEDGDGRVFELWQLREQLSRSNLVVYAKWYQGRATFFSREVFTWMLAYLETPQKIFSGESANVLEILASDSPLSTKQLKAASELEGRLLESTYNRALKPLWQSLAIVAFGEFDDSSFPSLGIGATSSLFEDMWTACQKISPATAEKALAQKLGTKSLFWKFAQKVKAGPRPNPVQ